MNIAVVGAGYVGLTLSACLADMGHRVTCVENDKERLATLRKGRPSFYEPGLPELVSRGMRSGNLTVTDALASAVEPASLVFIAVGTPSRDDGEVDLSAMEDVIHALAHTPHGNMVIAIKSTVPIGTVDRVTGLLDGRNGHGKVAYTPEFLSEGSAVSDMLHPHRVIVGTRSQAAAKMLAALYQPLGCPIVVTDPPTAEMIKYASNAFLATKVSFINEIAMICEGVGADVTTTAVGMGLDPRIGQHFLRAGIGFGGSCLPKDTRALVALARRQAVPASLLNSVLEVNAAQRDYFVKKIEAILGGFTGKVLAVFGLAFKGGTSDIRESPALDIARSLLAMGATVRAFDPAAEDAAARTVPELVCCSNAYGAAEMVDALLILTDWPEFEKLDWKRLREKVRQPLVLDGRGLRVAGAATDAGFTYIGPGADASPPVAVPEMANFRIGVEPPATSRRWAAWR